MIMSLTALELKVLNELADGSSLDNNCFLDFTNEDYELQVDDDTYQTYVDAPYRAKRLGMEVSSYKGVLGSLAKKGCMWFWDGDFGEDLAVIDEHNFNKIREHLGL